MVAVNWGKDLQLVQLMQVSDYFVTESTLWCGVKEVTAQKVTVVLCLGFCLNAQGGTVTDKTEPRTAQPWPAVAW